MQRALSLAALGLGHVSPNPMVGAVIVAPDGTIVGEGYHRRFGDAHAEVNAIAAVHHPDVLAQSTMYVTLEPCSHYGKTPPCASLIIEKRIPRIVVATLDPFDKVSGRGVAMLRSAGVEVVTGVLEAEARALNHTFFTAHTLRRPWVTLKWAQSSDGYTDWVRPDGRPHQFSSSLGATLVHRLRSQYDAIMVGSGTVILDNPRLDCRLWPGRSPRPVILDRSGRTAAVSLNMKNPIILDDDDLTGALTVLYDQGITSLLVEGGPRIHSSFIEQNLWDDARVEVAPITLGSRGQAPAPALPQPPDTSLHIHPNTIYHYTNVRPNHNPKRQVL